ILFSYFLLLFLCNLLSGLKIRNKLLGKCLQVPGGTRGGRVSLGECNTFSPVQEWRWLPEGQALSSQHTGECLTAPKDEYEGVVLQPCILNDGAWTCSKKGHITLIENRFHLSATKDSSLVFLLREHKQVISTSCTIPLLYLVSLVILKHLQMLLWVPIFVSRAASGELLITRRHWSLYISVCAGMGWKITMLVLSSLALVLGTLILIINVYSNRKKVVCVLKSYSPRPEMSVPGSPVPSERAALTEHAMNFPHSSPSLQRGEILIEWKDGTVTPLYEA
uniref:Si:dkey-245n4.2 n=1 Tax=Fundulus heteroclitus TaxID=8078 RepID=A0A3Q2T0B2_FUNHE